MVAMYTIAGKQVGSHILAMAVLGTVIGGSMYAASGKPKVTTTPPIQASSTDEEKFIKDFLSQAEAEEKKSKH